MTEDKSLLSLIPADVQNKIYDDGLAKPVRVAGEIAEDVMKSLRLVLIPFQLMAMGQTRVTKWMAEIEAKVPPERQVEAAPEIAGPVLERLRFTSDESKLKDLYLNLLTASVDSDHRDDAHPAFVCVIERLSQEDAFLFWHISKVARKDPKVTVRLQADNKQEAWIGVWDDPSFRVQAYDRRSRIQVRSSIELLESQSLIITRPIETLGHQTTEYECRMTNFGERFRKVCLPDDFDAPRDPNLGKKQTPGSE